MQSAFVVVGCRPGHRVPDHAAALLADPSPSLLLFAATDHLHRACGDVVVAAWHAHPGRQAWHVDERGAVKLFAGFRWSDGGPWPDPARWAADVTPSSLGLFAAAAVEPDGATHAFTDELGFRFLYIGERDGVVAFGSNATLVAHVLDRRPAKDPFGVCWLVRGFHLFGDDTGYRDVKVVPPDADVRWSNGSLAFERQRLWWLHDRRDESFETMVDVVCEGIITRVAAAVEPPFGERAVIDITGGRDFRVVLAAALAGGIQDRFDFMTIGPPDLADVEVASDLARIFGLTHHVYPDRPMATDLPYEELMPRFVQWTAGTVGIWDNRQLPLPEGFLRLQGLPGEKLRFYRRFPKPHRTVDSLVQAYRTRLMPSKLRLLRPDVEARYIERIVDELLDPVLGESSPADRVHAFSIRNQVRRARFGVLEELKVEPRMLPLYSTTALNVAINVGAEAREQQRLQHEVVRRCSALLAEQPYVNDRPAAAKPEPVNARSVRTGHDRRRAAMAEALSDRSNPTWDLVDRAQTLDAFERFDQLAHAERREVLGAITACVWLGSPVAEGGRGRVLAAATGDGA